MKPHHSRVIIAHGESSSEEIADLAEALEDVGIGVISDHTTSVGDSYPAAVSNGLAGGVPVVVWGTVSAAGSMWAHRIVHSARANHNAVIVVRAEKDAYLDPLLLDDKAFEWGNDKRRLPDLVAVIRRACGEDLDLGLSEAALRTFLERQLVMADLIDLGKIERNAFSRASPELSLRLLYLPLHLNVSTADRDDVVELLASALAKASSERTGQSLSRYEKSDKAATIKLVEHLASKPPALRSPARQVEKRVVAPAGPGPATDTSVAGRASTSPAHNRPVVERLSIGETLRRHRNVVILGNPGTGKSTILNWMTTVLTMKYLGHPEVAEVPEHGSLRMDGLIPVLVRCRDLEPPDFSSLERILETAMARMELRGRTAQACAVTLTELLRADRAILLVDGLDEIVDMRRRGDLRSQIERISRFHKCRIVVTSRIVGYRELGWRISADFAHAVIDELRPTEKDRFIERWADATSELEGKKIDVVRYRSEIHRPRIEELTGSPLLLYVFLLVRHRLGQLPERRVDLYRSAVQVMMDWRNDPAEPLSERDVVPKLGFVAFHLCCRGEVRVTEFEFVQLLREMKRRFPAVYGYFKWSPTRFVEEIDRRTELVSEVGFVLSDGAAGGTFEFRHRHIQEYLGAQALLTGVIPGKKSTTGIAARVLKAVEDIVAQGTRETLLEPIRLAVSAASQNDAREVFEVLLGAEEHLQPAALTIAYLCLRDEPRVPPAMQEKVFRGLAAEAQGGNAITILNDLVGLINDTDFERLLEPLLMRFLNDASAETARDEWQVYVLLIAQHGLEGRWADGWFAVDADGFTDSIDAATLCIPFVRELAALDDQAFFEEVAHVMLDFALSDAQQSIGDRRAAALACELMVRHLRPECRLPFRLRASQVPQDDLVVKSVLDALVS